MGIVRPYALLTIGVRMRLAARHSRISFAVPVELTGQYEIAADGRISFVEVRLHGTMHCAWVPLADLETAWEEPLDYWTLRRALLVEWINAKRDDASASVAV